MSFSNKTKYFLTAFLIAAFSVFMVALFPIKSKKEIFSRNNKYQLKLSNNYSDYKNTFVLNNHTTFIFHSNNFDEHSIPELKNIFSSVYSKISQTFNKHLSHPKIEYNIYGSFEQKGLLTGSTNFSSIEGNSIHVVINNSLKSNDGFSLAKMIIEKNFGITGINFIDDGLATYFSNNWRYTDYHEIAARLVKADAVPNLDYLFGNAKLKFESYLSYQPLGAVFIEFYILKFGSKSLKNLFDNSDNQKVMLLSLQTEWNDYLSQFSKKYRQKLTNQKEMFSPELPEFLKGFCFAHEGYQIYNGYISQSAVKSLEKLKSIGTNSISITPFTGMRNPKKAVPLSIWRAAGTENDESVIFISNAAKKLGIVPILKPHIYLHRSWPGAIKMATEKEWNEFAVHYFRWIKHYALLAQIYKIPLFVIGNELVEFTLTHPAKWREMIRKIRIIYDGKITYGSNWGKEFEQLTFWDAFDFIGISQYYPLSDKVNPNDNELLEGADKIMNRIERISKKFNKQVIFTEIGYRSSKSPWLTSNENEKSKRTVNNQSQLRTYKAMAKAIEGKTWLKGIFWWKWPSFLYYKTNGRHDLFTPMNKPAEKIVVKLFKKMR